MYIEISIARSGYNIEQGRDKAGTRMPEEARAGQGARQGTRQESVQLVLIRLKN